MILITSAFWDVLYWQYILYMIHVRHGLHVGRPAWADPGKLTKLLVTESDY